MPRPGRPAPLPERPRALGTRTFSFLSQGGGGDDTLTATGSVERLRGEGGAGDSCTLDGVIIPGGLPDPYRGCE